MDVSVKTMPKTLFISVFLLFSSSLLADQKAMTFIENMAKASKTLDYKGHFTLERGQQSTSYKFVHLVEGELEKQRLVFLDGKPFEVISDGHHLKCIHPGEQSTSADSDHAKNLGAYLERKHDLASIWSFYHAKLEGTGRVAGREVVRISLKPKDDHRYPMDFYIDKETGLMLKMVVLNAKMQPLERFHYVDIEYNNVSLADLEPEIDSYSTVMHERPAQNSQNTPSLWRLAWLPEGFRKEDMSIVPWSTQKDPVESLMYTDGLSAFSIFIEPAEKMTGDTSGTSSQIGSTSAVSQYLMDGDNYYRVTVVGEIPLMTAKQIAVSLKRKQ